MKTRDEIMQDLPNFYGTEGYTRWSALFPNFVLTDGARYIAEAAGAFWLMDAIASHRDSYKDEGFVIAVFSKNSTYHGGWTLRLVDDIPSNQIFAKQEIEYSDFPLDEITLYVIAQDDLWVVLLPSEY